MWGRAVLKDVGISSPQTLSIPWEEKCQVQSPPLISPLTTENFEADCMCKVQGGELFVLPFCWFFTPAVIASIGARPGGPCVTSQ